MTKNTKTKAPKNENTTTSATSTKKAKQLGLGDGYERKKIVEVEEAAEAYREVRNKRMDWTVKESEAQAELDAVLEKHGIRKYIYVDDEGDEQEAYVPETKPKAKVRKVKQAKAKADE